MSRAHASMNPLAAGLTSQPTRSPGSAYTLDMPAREMPRSYTSHIAGSVGWLGAYSRPRYISSLSTNAPHARATSTTRACSAAVRCAPVGLCGKLITIALMLLPRR